MPFDGSGNYTPAPAPNFPAISGDAISSTYYNAVINDIAAAMSNVLCRDGQAKPTANFDWNAKNLTNVGNFGAATATISGSFTIGSLNFSAAPAVISVAGTERMRLDTTGYLGIATTSPARPLHVRYASAVVGQYALVVEGQTGGYGTGISFQSPLSGGALTEMARITADGEAAWDTTAANQDAGLRFYTTFDGTLSERVRLSAAGNVGIGTTAPQGLLHLRANSVRGRVEGTGNGQFATWQYHTKSSAGATVIFEQGAGITADNAFELYDNQNAQLSFRYISGASGYWAWHTNGVEKLRLDNAGNFGVGTSSPTALGGYTSLTINNATNGSILDLMQAGSVKGRLVATSGSLSFETAAAVQMVFLPAGVEKMRLDASGNLGVGVTNPAAFGRLVVAGSATASVMVTTSGNGTTGAPVETQIAGGVYSGGGSPAGMYSLNAFSSSSAHYLSFKTTNASNVLGERFRFGPDGQLGIGGANYGISGQVLTSQGAGAAPVWSTAAAGTVTSVSGTGSANGLSLSGTVTSSGNLTLSGSVTSVASGATIDGVTIGYRSIPRSTTSGTAAVGDVGKCVAVSAGITIPNATFAAGDAVSIYNDSASAVTITQGASLTLRQAGTANTGNRTLAARGMATIWFNSSSEAIISGAGVS